MTQDGRNKMDLIDRIGWMEKAFRKKKSLTNNVCLNIKNKLFKFHAQNVKIFSYETWTVSSIEKSKSDTFEMQRYRKTLKVLWTDEVTEEEKEQKKSDIGRDKTVRHVQKHESVLKTVTGGDVKSKEEQRELSTQLES